MELYNLITIYADKFIPIFIRVAVILSFIPFIGAQQTPVMVRAGLSIALTLMILPVVNVDVSNPVRAIFEAFFVGSAMGLATRLILSSIEMAAQWISLSMGLSMAAVFNPTFGETLSPLSLLYSMISMALFFMFDVHFFIIEGIVRSFDISSMHYSGMFSSVLKLNAFFFPMALKIAAPVMLVQFLVNLSLGFLSKAIPQANIFFISFPLLLTLGMIFIVLSLPLSIIVIERAFMTVKDTIMVITR